MILKAGTYRFNDVPNFDALPSIDSSKGGYINFTSNGVDYGAMAWAYGLFLYITPDGSEETVYSAGNTEQGINDGWQDTAYQEQTIVEQEVDDTFGTWYIANTNYNEINGSTATPLAEITYNGETIAQLNAGEMATLSCEGKKMASDVVVKVNEPPIPDGYVKPEGTLEITLNNIEAHPIDCSQYANVTVNTAEPLKISDPTVLDNITDSPWGVGGSVFLYVGETTDTYENGAYYLLEDTEK